MIPLRRRGWMPPPGKRRVVEVPPQREDQHPEPDRKRGDGPRRRVLRRRTFALAVGLLVCILAAAAGYLYLDYAQHFESTDDAFIAARQSPIAPKVSGYISAVPVTDNQHVAAGSVIARIDDRDYRIALEQAQAQVASAEANIQNIDACSACRSRSSSAIRRPMLPSAPACPSCPACR
jgi:membrane fusion protein, multidrug efflux system